MRLGKWTALNLVWIHLSIYLYRSCSGSSGGTDSFTTFLSTGDTIGIVVGSLAGAGVLVTIIMVIICHHKKKSARVWAVSPQSQQMIQTHFVNAPLQQWSPGVFYQARIGPMNNISSQPPPAYFPTKQANVQVWLLFSIKDDFYII